MGQTRGDRSEHDNVSVADAARALVERSTAAQHQPVRVDDPAVLAVVGVLLGSVRAPAPTSRPFTSSATAPPPESDLVVRDTSAA